MGSDNSAILRSQLTDSQKQMLRNRERRIKIELEHVRLHRKMIRDRRSNKEFPVIAVVGEFFHNIDGYHNYFIILRVNIFSCLCFMKKGYTNAGKTSLIKALTNEEKLEPKNKLFATLDVTAHPGFDSHKKFNLCY